MPHPKEHCRKQLYEMEKIKGKKRENVTEELKGGIRDWQYEQMDKISRGKKQIKSDEWMHQSG